MSALFKKKTKTISEACGSENTEVKHLTRKEVDKSS
jgi:hypothetical protein